ncbi:diacylglycerol kinase [Ramlibacter alkalitolerans]|uniref:Diacylglycerol kinase n=1 Tax=Ramlibacter alkalitolerans TaxID=2039631 RepID=A0ABS1JKA8_9BURK|nr:diacylglycerol kinase [Ramlibacter alkalitolerans]MBL0424663.1 diacylglycerol kinase [Ramlibacter alkalitolerans]
MSHRDALPEFANEQKGRTGFNRVWHATGYSLAGLRAGWDEAAFRVEACLSFVMLPLAFFIGAGWVEVALLAGSVVLVMIVELLNTAVEAAIDRIGLERHALSKRAKDMASAAVFLSLFFAGGVWLTALVRFFSA